MRNIFDSYQPYKLHENFVESLPFLPVMCRDTIEILCECDRKLSDPQLNEIDKYQWRNIKMRSIQVLKMHSTILN